MSPAPLRAFPSFPPRRGELHWRASGKAPFPFAESIATRTFRFGRSAVHAGLQAMGVQPGDEVLMPGYHHGVEVETVRSLGAQVRYYPIESDLTVRTEAIEPLLSPRTRVIYTIHYFGLPQPLAALRQFCSERKLLLFEDCALSLLSADGEIPLGSVGEAAAFCLYKTLPVPDGGLLAVNAPRPQPTTSGERRDYAGLTRDSLRWMRSLGPSRPVVRAAPSAEAPPAEDRLRSGFPFFDSAQLDLAMSPLTRLLLNGLDLAEVKRRRRRNYVFWTEAVADHLECVRPMLGDGVCPLLFPVLVDDKAGLQAALSKEGIEIHNWWHRWYGGAAPGERPENDRLRRHLIGLPVQQNLSLRELDRFRVVLRKLLPKHF